MKSRGCVSILCVLFVLTTIDSYGVEIAVLDETNWDTFALEGKEADQIYGDVVLRNADIVAVIGKDVPTRNANMTISRVGGCLIDLTLRKAPNDNLGAFYPAIGRELRLQEVRVDGAPKQLDETDQALRGKVVELEYHALLPEGVTEDGEDTVADVTVIYRLEEGDHAMQVSTIYRNSSSQAVSLRLVDPIRVDGEFETGVDHARNVVWAYDRFWGQAYGICPERSASNLAFRNIRKRESVIDYGYTLEEGQLSPGASRTLTRFICPAHDVAAVKAIAAKLTGEPLDTMEVSVVDADGPVAAADVQLKQGQEVYGLARTDNEGNLDLEVPRGELIVIVYHQARGEVCQEVTCKLGRIEIEMPRAGYLTGNITGAKGDAIACKVDVAGVAGTPDPDFGPDSAVYGIRNLVYTPDGKFRVAVRPGNYSVLISHGPEFDAVIQDVEVKAGEDTLLQTKLIRSVDTSGWISTDYHSHSSPSGDNTSSQRGRVLNLLAEQIEFAPCTEHNRISTYLPHLQFFNAVDRMATCSGIELTGKPLPINHQNAFPLVRKPRTQDGGAPLTDANPVLQIQRLAMWDANSEKLVQSNHPNIPQMLSDRDLDGIGDGGFKEMFDFMHVIEVHPPETLFEHPESLPDSRSGRGNAIFHWLQLLNLGYRIPGVVNTDAHWNFHGSGWLRNYVRSSQDDPAQIDIMEMVRASKAGHLVVTNGPFLEVRAKHIPDVEEKVAEVGDELLATDGRIELSIRVQCPNWLDVNRVQVFRNGRPDTEANFTRHSHPDAFSSSTVRFESTVPLQLECDTHVIVAAAGEGLVLGRVVGPEHSETMPIAVSNPIFVDVDGGGFAANGDMLDLPLAQPKEETTDPQ